MWLLTSSAEHGLLNASHALLDRCSRAEVQDGHANTTLLMSIKEGTDSFCLPADCAV